MHGKVAEVFNEVVDLNERMAEELARLRQSVGKQGKLKQRASLGDVRGFWKDSIGSVNALIDDLVHPTSETARVIGAVAQGDLSQTMALEVDDRPLEGRVPAHGQDHQQDGRPARVVRVRRSRASRARSAPKASWAGRPR